MLEKITSPIADRNLNIDRPSMDTPFFLMACLLCDLPLNVLCFGPD
jgi:hypothetical protein